MDVIKDHIKIEVVGSDIGFRKILFQKIQDLVVCFVCQWLSVDDVRVLVGQTARQKHIMIQDMRHDKGRGNPCTGFQYPEFVLVDGK